MFRIRRVFDDLLPVDAAAIDHARRILEGHFPEAQDGEFSALPEKLRNPLRYRFRSILMVAEKQNQVRGVALMLHAPDLKFCYLDYLAATAGKTGGGVGSALYLRLREEARGMGAFGIFCECLPDDEALCREKELLPQNRARLRFYERCGMRAIEGTAYATPLSESDACPPLLLFDGLGGDKGLARSAARRAVRAILERKYADRCPPGYIRMVVDSFKDDPVRLARPHLPHKEALRLEAGRNDKPARGLRNSIALFVSENHDLHHVHERGYVESPARVESILTRLENSGLFERCKTRKHPERVVTDVHDPGLVQYMKRCCALLGENKAVYPYVFPVRNAARPPQELAVRAGYYCIDTFTPLHRHAFSVARNAVDVACSAAASLLEGFRLAYALVRPPGHHAERKVFGGFCYLNNAAIAAHMLSKHGKVAVLDVDYHHGNGTQDIFYQRADVLTLSIHGKPSIAYPYFSGFAEEKGYGPGLGANRNYPLGEHVDGAAYRAVLKRALARVRQFGPTFLVVSLGLDPAKGDPTGSWSLMAGDFEKNGRMVGSLGLPTVVVQEGGYRVPSLGGNALRFFLGLRDGLHARMY